MSPPFRASPTEEEAEYIERWFQRLRERNGPDVPPRTGWLACLVCGVLGWVLAPVGWVLGWWARRHEEAAWRRERGRVKEGRKGGEVPPATDLGKWRLDCENGRQVWWYDAEGGREQRVDERYQVQGRRGARTRPAESVEEATRRAAALLEQLQSEDGHWANDYGGPLFLMPGLVITQYIIAKEGGLFPAPFCQEMVRYLRNVQNADGGWGLHIAGESTMFGTALNYVALRMLGVPPDDLAKPRGWIRARGGATSIPSWGKFWLAVAGLYHWEGVRPVTPELWLLPTWLPVHPGRMWCHSRMVYLSVGYLYALRYQAPDDPLLAELRKELYTEPFESIDWRAAAEHVAEEDTHYPVTCFAKLAFGLLRIYERRPIAWLRRRALQYCQLHMEYDDVSTNFICLGPVNKVMNLLALHVSGGVGKEHLELSAARLYDYMWMGDDGMKMNGYNGSQLWDTAFACQAVQAAGLSDCCKGMLKKGIGYIHGAQVLHRPPYCEQFFRADSSGAWNFSTASQGWQVSDCTAEGLRAALCLGGAHGIPHLPTDRVYAAVDQILALRNPDDGAWASYEARRSPVWLELLNPADVFSRIMVEYTYPECTSACMQTLALFHKMHPQYRAEEIRQAIACGAAVLRRLQNADGSWYGSWGVCFTYGTMFGVEGLIASGEPVSCEEIRRACEYLLEKQHDDGGWGEHVHSCAAREWIDYPSQVVQTAFALITLVAAQCPNTTAVRKAAEFLLSKQEEDGGWSQHHIAGMFNGTCGISYPFYPIVFPLWALGLYTNHYQHKAV